MTTRRVPLRQGVALVVAISGGIAGGSGWAQTTANPTTTSQPTLTEIIVTAQKREQNIQDVPISVIALSSQQLKDAGVTDIKDMQVLTPGLTVTSTTNESSTTARIRGIGTVGDNPGLESSVGVVIDGVYRPRNGVGFGNLGEIEQIEVLEGPQGELFGKNNDAGVIVITTKRPSTTFGATAEVTGGNFNDREASASITGPIGDISAARLYVGFQKRDGWMNVDTGAGPNTNDRANDRNMFTVRGQYRVTPNDNIDVLFIGDYSKRNEVCCVGVATVLGPFAGVANAIASVPPLGGQVGATAIAAGGGYQAYSNYPWGQQVRDTGFSAQLDWNLGFGKFTSITGWRDNTLEAGNDTDYTAIDLLWEPDTKANETDFKQFSEELRLAGKEGALDWLVGGFFANETLTSNQTLWAGKDLDLYLSGVVGAAGGLPNPFAAPPLGLPLLTELTGQPPGSLLVPGVAGYSDSFRQTSKSFAFFSSETYTITQGLDLTGGVRYTHEKKDLASNYNDTDGGAGCGQILSSTSPLLGTLNAGQDAFLYGYGCSVIFNPFFNKKADSQSLSENNVSGTVKLAYRFNEDVMAYLSFADGYKASGFNLARVTNPFAPTFLGTLQPVLDTSFPKETVDSYELGIKTTLADHTLRLDAAVFDQKYKDFQLNTYTGILFVVSSIPHVDSKGAEFNAAWATPLSGLSLSSGVTYTFTNITEFGNAAYLFAPNTADPSLPRLNNRLSFSPLWSGVASATYRVPITSSLDFRASVSEKYNSSYNTGSDLDPRKIQGAYGILNGRIGVAAPDDKWAVEAWGANLADKYYYQVAFDAPYQYNQIDAFLGAPRTFGLTARVKF
jgi:iron complex outermembrane recepter protein